MSSPLTLVKTACVCLYEVSTKHILTVSRKTNHNIFTMPGGKLEPEETFGHGALRELKEETGYSFWHANIYEFDKHNVLFEDFNYNTEKPEVISYCKTYFWVINDKKHELINSPVSPTETGVIKWQSPEVLLKPENPFIDYNVKFIKVLTEHAKYI
jgi:ADP-ribose pyrophosphatase YjhB (NUDIX family)